MELRFRDHTSFHRAALGMTVGSALFGFAAAVFGPHGSETIAAPIVGGVLGLVALGGVALVLLLVFSPSKTKDTAAKDTAGNKDKEGGSSGSPATAVPEGVITFSSQIGTRDRDRVLGDLHADYSSQ